MQLVDWFFTVIILPTSSSNTLPWPFQKRLGRSCGSYAMEPNFPINDLITRTNSINIFTRWSYHAGGRGLFSGVLIPKIRWFSFKECQWRNLCLIVAFADSLHSFVWAHKFGSFWFPWQRRLTKCYLCLLVLQTMPGTLANVMRKSFLVKVSYSCNRLDFDESYIVIIPPSLVHISTQTRWHIVSTI